MSKLYDVIGAKNYTNLLADPQGADVIGINVKPGEGELAMGTLMVRGNDGLFAAAAAADITAEKFLVVLKEAVDAGASAAPAEGEDVVVAEDAAAYRAGCFIDGAVILKAGTALTDANKVILRGMNIVFDKKMSTGTFNNGVTA